MSNVEVGRTIYPANREAYGGRGETGSRDKVTKRRRGKEETERKAGSSAIEGRLYLNMCAWVIRSF